MGKKKYSLLEKIGGVAIVLSIPGILVMLLLASNNIISAGIPIISFGALFILIPLLGKDIDDSIRNQTVSKIIFITLGFLIISIGISIIYESFTMFIYSFVNLFGIIGLALSISLIYTYLYNKKYCVKKVSAICSGKIVDKHSDHKLGHSFETSRPVFTIRNEDGSKGQKLVYDISSNRIFVIGQTYELMVNPKNYNEFYILGDSFFQVHRISIIIASLFIASTIVGDFVLLISNWP